MKKTNVKSSAKNIRIKSVIRAGGNGWQHCLKQVG
jgi:hypothetical protein